MVFMLTNTALATGRVLFVIELPAKPSEGRSDMKTLKFILKWVAIGIVIWCMFVALIYLLCPCAANAAEPLAVVEFESVERLVALKDSVVDVCDTAIVTSDSCLEGYSTLYYNPWDTMGVKFYKITITCRELVCVTVTKQQVSTKIISFYIGTLDTATVNCDPKYDKDCKTIPGQAIICYREVQ